MRKKQKYSGYYSVNEKLKKKPKNTYYHSGNRGGAAKMNMVVGKKTKMGGGGPAKISPLSKCNKIENKKLKVLITERAKFARARALWTPWTWAFNTFLFLLFFQ